MKETSGMQRIHNNNKITTEMKHISDTQCQESRLG